MTLILDGGMGHELKLRGVKQPAGWEGWFIGGALANRDNPAVVRGLHEEYFDAGADVATTNNFVATEYTLDKAAAAVAAEARDACAERSTGRKLVVAGSLPPLRESYEPLSSAQVDDARRQYATIAAALADKCDVLLCETMASAAEGRAAGAAASAAGLPVWVSWTIEDSAAGRLRSGETLADAVASVLDVPGLAALLVNCSAPFAVGAALPKLSAVAPPGILVGGYANGFRQTTSEWKAQQAGGASPSLGEGHGGEDEFDADGVITPECYADYAEAWAAKAGRASIVGGCCGTGPAHVRAMSRRLRAKGSGLQAETAAHS